MRVLRATAAVLAVGLVGSCYDFDATTAGGPLDDEVDSGGRDASSGDAGDAGVNDAAVDASTDSSVVADGSAGGSFCASFAHADGGLFFCDDFDEHGLPGAWISFGETHGKMSEVAIDARTDAVSLPNVLDLEMPAASPDDVIDVSLRTTLGVPKLPATLRFAFSVEPLKIDITEGAAIVLSGLDFLDEGGDRYTLGLAINVASGLPALSLGEQAAFTDGGVSFVPHALAPSSTLTMSTWSAVVIEVDWSTSTQAEAKVYVNGVVALDVDCTIPVKATMLQIGIGTAYVTEPSPVWELRYDNVVFSTE